MNTTRISLIAATTAVVAWAAKAVAIGTAGGLNKSPFEGPFFLVGLAAFVVAVSVLGVSLAGHHGWLARIGAVVAAIVGTVVVTALTGIAVDALVPSDHWAFYELNLWLISTGVLAVGAWHASRESRRAVIAA